MSGKFMTWTLKRPSNLSFDKYKKRAPGADWWSKDYIDGDLTEPDRWAAGARGFLRTIEKNPDKFYAIGMHEFGASDNGDIFNMGAGNIMYPNGYMYVDPNVRVLNAAEDDITEAGRLPNSLLYLMHTYPNIRWGLQVLATSNASGNRVNSILSNESKPLFTAIGGKDGTPATFEPKKDEFGNTIYVNAQDEFIRQVKKIAEIYLSKDFPIKDIEIDFEKSRSEDGEAELFANLLVRVKNEICIPLGLGLRVNLLAMTGENLPDYYRWHDYRTLARKGVVDEYQLMSYDFSWGGSAPGPSTPLWWLKEILENVKDIEDEGLWNADQVFIGNAGYGRRWPLSDRRMGVTFDYKMLMQAQNGMYTHNLGERNVDGYWYFNDQDFIPFAGFNDPDSDYQITYLHVYDKFAAKDGTLEGGMVRPDDYVTSYSALQSPIFTGIQKRLTEPTTFSGNANYNSTEGAYKVTPVVFDGITYSPYISSKGKWKYDELSSSCVQVTDPSGQDGSLTYVFTLPSAGSYKIIAIVGFGFYGNDNFHVDINGVDHHIGGNIPDWYPYITNPAYHYWDCGTYSLETNNTISVGVTNGAQLLGFVICDEYEDKGIGGRIKFPADLQPMMKRGNRIPAGKDAKGNDIFRSEIIEAKFPSEMTLTGELLRRPPRPAILWEDMFGPHIKNDFTKDSELTNATFYKKAKSGDYTSGSGSTLYVADGKNNCVAEVSNVGFSKGVWKVNPKSKTDSAHTWSDATSSSSQIVLNKTMLGAAHIEIDSAVDEGNTNAKYGIRLMNEKGEPDKGWAFRLNYSNGMVEFFNLSTNSVVGTSVPMSDDLKNDLGGRYVMKLERINNEFHFIVGKKLYLKVPDTISGELAYGAYADKSRIRVYRLNVSTLERFEPLEKVNIYADGEFISTYGEVQRTKGYDQYGYIIHTSLPGDLTAAVRAIPSESEVGGEDPSEVDGRAGTIFEIEEVPEQWSLDYRNLPLETIDSWRDKKDITIEMKDPGIWLRSFYVGDSEGYSVAYNSDKIGFIKTSQMVLDYGCRGIAMWTLGQEDPSVFSYLPKAY